MQARSMLCCSVTLALHATAFSLSFNAVLTSEQQKKESTGDGRGGDLGKGEGEDKACGFLRETSEVAGEMRYDRENLSYSHAHFKVCSL